MVLLVAFVSFATAFALTPPVIRLSFSIGAVDIPHDWRRMHTHSIPRAGGLAIAAGLFAGVLLAGTPSTSLLWMLLGAAAVLLLGLADDIFSLGARLKLCVQLSAVALAVMAGGFAEGINALWAVLWVALLANAHNFIDGLDGLFAGSAAIEGGALFWMLTLAGEGGAAAAALALSAACLAFRCYNRAPARIFAGDCGSATVGFLLGVLSLPLFSAGAGSVAVLSPLLLFAYPCADLATAVLRRILRGKSPFCADRGHLHHRLCDTGIPPVLATRILLLLTAGFCAIALPMWVPALLPLASLAALGLALLLMRIRRFVEDFHRSA